ncbi:iron ABC transporter permease [Clostridium sp. MSJ-4]|uniref:Iron ABC transporter permease n=1 Tax=Clostridium simiarum TaxID=2841506 RepID=A0ABS6EZX7_9CLOT|nr:iron ABC transporter permease [Clostridium simiarum]MBU5591596.1 iron ABC transporter permease [Clostridium simiarum]
MDKSKVFKKNKTAKWSFMIIAMILTFFASLFLGRYVISPKTVLNILINGIFNTNLNASAMESSIVIGIRLPRTILSMLIGAALSVSGATYQGLFKNPLVSPDVLGVSSGAGFGAVLAILFTGISGITPLYAFGFGIFSVFLTYFFAKAREEVSMMSLVLSGMIVSSIFSALISLVKYVADPYDKLPAITYWLMGSFAKVTYEDLKLVIVPIMIGIIMLNLLRWRINILSLGDEESLSLGINPVKIRFVAIFISTVLTAASVSVVGIVGWVGLVIPHISRILVGVDHKDLIPASCILGAIFLTLVDIIARSASSVEIPIGIITSLLGAPFFAFLLRNVRRSRGEW